MDTRHRAGRSNSNDLGKELTRNQPIRPTRCSAEIERIQKRAFDQASELADATGDNSAVREYLGLPKADPGIPPVLLLPVQPGAAGQSPRGALPRPTDAI
jgi:hypothetical protein